MYEIGIEPVKVTKLISGAINYLLRNKQDPEKYKYYFNSIIYEAEPIEARRLAWCYNDLGICLALWQAGDILNNETWKQEAIEILTHSTKLREVDDTRIIDAGLCHGASGVAHLYNRMYNYSNIELFKNASAFWFERTLKMASFEDGLLGYKSFHSADLGGWQNDYSLLEGVSGIGISMISSIADIEPKWDRVLLLS
jgi:lantibiotic modifying enzyme